MDRFFSVEVPLSLDYGKDNYEIHANLIKAVESKISIDKIKNKFNLSEENIQIVRKSFDGRLRNKLEPRFVYTVDVNIPEKYVKILKLRFEDGKLELNANKEQNAINDDSIVDNNSKIPRVVVVGAGPAGLFAAIILAKKGLNIYFLFFNFGHLYSNNLV